MSIELTPSLVVSIIPLEVVLVFVITVVVEAVVVEVVDIIDDVLVVAVMTPMYCRAQPFP